MIRCQELVPDYYIEQSRDFQVLCRLYDYTLNALKFNIDTMQSLTNTKLVKDVALPLVGDKFGIYDKHAYTNRELLTALPTALKNKGSLKSVKILLNAYLESLNIFDYAIAYHSKDESSAKEISDILSRDIKPYTIVIVLSTSPKFVDLHVLDEFLKMVLPCGMIVEYAFGLTEIIIDKFKYSENVFMYFVPNNGQSVIKGKDTYYYASPLSITPQLDTENKFISKVTSNIDLLSVGISSVTDNYTYNKLARGVKQVEGTLVKNVEKLTVSEVEKL